MKHKQKIDENILRIKELISEQLGSGFNCEADPTSPSGYSCVANQFGAGQFATLAACQASGCETPVVTGCEGAPTLNCYFCLHYPGGHCVSFQDYYTYGSGAPGMNPSQAFLNSQVVSDPGQPGVYLSHQGGPIYDTEAECIQQSGCDPSHFANSNSSSVVGNLTPGCKLDTALNYDMYADGCEDMDGVVDTDNIDCCDFKQGGGVKPGWKDKKYKDKKHNNYYSDYDREIDSRKDKYRKRRR